MLKSLSDESKYNLAEQLPEKTLRNVFEELVGDLINEYTDEELEQKAHSIVRSFSQKEDVM